MADTNFKFCTACGRKVALNARFCGVCGAALGAKEKSVQAPTQKASDVAPVKKGTAPTLQGLTAKEWCEKGTALNELHRYQEALECFDKALEIDPRFSAAWVGKGTAIAALGDVAEIPTFVEVIQCYDKALEIDPRYAVAWVNKGMILVAVSRRELRLLGSIQEGVGRRALNTLREALQCFNKAFEIDPNNANAQKFKRELPEEIRGWDNYYRRV